MDKSIDCKNRDSSIYHQHNLYNTQLHYKLSNQKGISYMLQYLLMKMHNNLWHNLYNYLMTGKHSNSMDKKYKRQSLDNILFYKKCNKSC